MRVRCRCILMIGLIALLSQTEAFVMAPCSLSILSRSSPRSAAPSCSMPSRSTPRFALRMGFLGWDFGKDLGGKGIREILGIISCEASHILIKGPGSAERCKELKEMVLDGISIPMGIGIQDSFAEVAREYSQCPSAKHGGNLGVFKPGQMVPEFDRAAFKGGILSVIGPVETKFGNHLILVTRRTGDAEEKSGGCG